MIPSTINSSPSTWAAIPSWCSHLEACLWPLGTSDFIVLEYAQAVSHLWASLSLFSLLGMYFLTSAVSLPFKTLLSCHLFQKVFPDFLTTPPTGLGFGLDPAGRPLSALCIFPYCPDAITFSALSTENALPVLRYPSFIHWVVSTGVGMETISKRVCWTQMKWGANTFWTIWQVCFQQRIIEA